MFRKCLIKSHPVDVYDSDMSRVTFESPGVAQARRESELQEQAYLQRLRSAERGRDEALAALAQLKQEDVAVKRMERQGIRAL